MRSGSEGSVAVCWDATSRLFMAAETPKELNCGGGGVGAERCVRREDMTEREPKLTLLLRWLLNRAVNCGGQVVAGWLRDAMCHFYGPGPEYTPL